MSSAAKPFTKREYEILKRVGLLAEADIPRLATTIEQGFAPDEPTPDELVEWAATEVMGWRNDKIQGTPCWTTGGNALIYLQRMWRPDQNWWDLIQVLMAARPNLDFDFRHHHANVYLRRPGGDPFHSPLEALRWLYEELAE